MTTDRYTKGVLTVIACALLYIAAMLSGAPVRAQSGGQNFAAKVVGDARPQPVIVVGWGTVREDGQVIVTTVKGAGGMQQSDPTLPAKVTEMPPGSLAVSLGVTPDRPLPVGLTAITASSAWEPIRTRTEPEPTSKVPGRPR